MFVFNVYNMRKFLLTALVTIGMIGSSVAQLAIPGEIFASNPARFNGRKVTLKNIEMVKTEGHQVGPAIGAPSGPVQVGAPGPVNSPTAPATAPCRPPRGYSQVDVFFKGEPEFKACFFMMDRMKEEMERQMGHQSAPAQITLRGDIRTGYNVTFFRLGM